MANDQLPGATQEPVSQQSRREFLQLSAGLAGAALVPPAIASETSEDEPRGDVADRLAPGRQGARRWIPTGFGYDRGAMKTVWLDR